MSDSIKLGSVALDCPNSGKLAEFYADITGGKVTYLGDAWATVRGPGGRIDFQTAPAHTAPTWPDPKASMQMHLDFDVDDLDAAETRVLAAGATKYAFQPNGHCRVYADPAGHPSACPPRTSPRGPEQARLSFTAEWSAYAAQTP